MYKTRQYRFGSGSKDDPVNIGFLKVLMILILFPVAIIAQIVIVLFIILLNALTLGVNHITFKVEPKPLRMPDGSIRQPTTPAGTI